MERRTFLAAAGGTIGALWARPALGGQDDAKRLFNISLAEWSLHRALYGGELTHLDFITRAREVYGIEGVEFVNSFFKDKAEDKDYLKQMITRADDAGVRQLLIMIDGEGRLGDPDDAARTQAVQNHVRWLDAAKTLGCHSIRVNAASEGTWDEQAKLAGDGLSRLTALGAERGLNVIVENHGGLSSNGKWLSEVIRSVDNPRCGTLPDFGNFCLDWSRKDDPDAWYDRYEGVREMMPFAKAVSAKSYEFDDKGNEVRTDFRRMVRIVLEAGYRQYLGIEYEGDQLSEHDGIVATKKLLERVRDELKGQFE